MKLTDTQAQILAAAADHPEHLAIPPERLPAGARQKVAQALLKQDLVIAVHRRAYDARALWPVDGDAVLLKITAEGLRAVGVEPALVTEEDAQSEAAIQRGNAERRAAAEVAAAVTADVPLEAPTESAEAGDAPKAPPIPPEQQPPQEGPTAPAEAASASRAPTGLRAAATAVLTAWDASQDRADLEEAIAVLRATLAGKPARAAREPGAPRKPREGTKQQQVLAMLRRTEGATIAQVIEATGWQAHTVRGFFAGLKTRQGIAVSVAERVRQVGPGKEGAKGSFSIYRIADAG